MKKFLDLSHPIENGMPAYPGTPSIRITEIGSIEQDGFREKSLTMSSHTGTHMDAPAHMLQKGSTIDELNLSAFTGTGMVLKIDEIASGHLDKIISFEKDISATDFVLLHTGHDRYWGKQKYYTNIPALSNEIINYLCGFELKGIGIDAISIDPLDSTTMENHHTILGKNMIIIENLTNLSALSGKKFRFNCFPLPLKSGDGSPVRAIAEIDE